MSAATMNEMERLIRERDELAEKLAVATKRLEDGHLAPVGWISGDRYEAVSREKMDYRRRWKEVCEERDALAAHVERCRAAFSGLSEYWNGCEGMAAEYAAQNAMDVACDMLEELPETSLDRLKAQWQTEAVVEFGYRYGPESEVRAASQSVANELRRQAEGDKS